uniref:Uncharacterized protein n=1 Tax=Vitis vinifera TaxID=29760 RepID=F6HTV2_VITVI
MIFLSAFFEYLSAALWTCKPIPLPFVKMGERPLPTARLEEIIFVLKELARLVIHPETASVLPLHPYLKGGLAEENHDRRPHLLVLFASFCELVISRFSGGKRDIEGPC